MGAGPGDPGLLTLRGKEALERADVVLYYALANSRLLDFAPAGAERILVGHRHGQETVGQNSIEEMLVDYARRGKSVVRLKGGDPFVFGRGAEEAQACAIAGVPFSVIPGVSSASAAPAYAGIALTHRDLSSSYTVVTGRPGRNRDGEEVEADWESLARGGGTLVLLMAMTRISEISAKLIGAGMSAETPAAAGRWGTLPRQKTVTGCLGDIANTAAAELIRPPVVFVIGDVVRLAESIYWYEKLPLFGRRIVVTRARHQAAEFSRRLEESGAWVLEYPTIEIRRLEIADSRLDEVAGADWLLFSSVNGVEHFFASYLAAGRDLRELAGVGIAAIGPATAAAVKRRGLKVDVQPLEYRAEALLEALGEVRGMRMILARAKVAREVLPEQLRARGAEVTVLPVYQTVVPPDSSQFTEFGEVDMVTFTSASTVGNFDRINGGRAAELLAGVKVAAIGPITAAALRDKGIGVDAMPHDYTIPALAAEIERCFANG